MGCDVLLLIVERPLNRIFPLVSFIWGWSERLSGSASRASVVNYLDLSDRRGYFLNLSTCDAFCGLCECIL